MFTKTIVLAHPGWAAPARERLQRLDRHTQRRARADVLPGLWAYL